MYLELTPYSDRLRPETCYHACTWTNISSSNNNKRLCATKKYYACIDGANSGQERLKNPNATSEEPRAKGGQGQKQGTAQAPCTHHHIRRWQAT